jgi:uncharacterized protein
MKSLQWIVLLLAGTMAVAWAENPRGDWSGTLRTAAGNLRLQLHIEQDAEGRYSGVMDSVDQGVNGIPILSITEKDGALVLDVASIGARYEGRWSTDRLQWEGTWQQGDASLPLNFVRGMPVKPVRPQNPVKPYPYSEEEVAYKNPRTGLRLAGALTLPRGKGPFPAALLITGSGQQDRDETVMDHKPFWVIADHLTRQGIAVLRVDDRGVGGSEAGDLKKATSADFVTDVEAAIAFLQQRPQIAAGQIGLIGHSEGGMIAPMVASQNPAVAWIVLLAGPGVAGEEILLAQGRLIGQSAGYPPEQLDRIAELNKQVYEIVKEEPDAAARLDKTRPLVATAIREAGMPASVVDSQVQASASEWLRYFLMYDPAPVLKKVQCPVLALNGEKDLQVPPKENLAGLRQALAHNRDVQLQELPGLNHLFQTAPTGAPKEYAQLSETFSPKALSIISQWILAHTQK